MDQEFAKKKRLMQENLASAEKFLAENMFEGAAIKARHVLEQIVNIYIEKFAPEDVFLTTFEKIESLKRKKIITESSVNTLHGVRMAVNKGGAHFDENGVNANKIKTLIPPLKKEAELLWTVCEQPKSNYNSTTSNTYGQSSSYGNTGKSFYRSTSSSSSGNAGSSSYVNTGGASYNKSTSNSSYGSAEHYYFNSRNSKDTTEFETEKQAVLDELDVEPYYRLRDNMYVSLSLITLMFTLGAHFLLVIQHRFIFTYFEMQSRLLAAVGLIFFAIIGWRGALQRYIEKNKILSKLPKRKSYFIVNSLMQGFIRSSIQGAVYIGVFCIVLYGYIEKLGIVVPISENVLFIVYAIFISFIRCYGKLIRHIFGKY